MKIKSDKTEAVAYLRTSSASNCGADRDSEKRQRVAIASYAKRAGVAIVDTYYDEAVSGADAIDSRPGFQAMLERIEGNGVRTIIVETANRFARDLMVQEVGFAMLQRRGVSIIAADSPTAFLDDGPTSVLIRQVLGAVSQFEKAMLVAKLKGARDRIIANGIKCGGRKGMAEIRPDVVALTRKLARSRGPKAGKRTLAEIADALAAAGHLTSKQTPYSPSAVSKILEISPADLEKAQAECKARA